MKTKLNIALPKGRLSKQVFQLLDKAGYQISMTDNGRKLVIDDELNQFRYFFVKPTDVPTYVDRGVCDVGIVGKDTLIESNKQVYELLDLKIGKCKMVLAGNEPSKLKKQSDIIIATKFPTIAKTFFNDKKEKVVIVKLNGSVELGPIVGLSDAIVDIYETGKTLRANGLKVFEEILDISAYMISNKASYRMKNDQIISLLENIKQVV